MITMIAITAAADTAVQAAEAAAQQENFWFFLLAIIHLIWLAVWVALDAHKRMTGG